MLSWQMVQLVHCEIDISCLVQSRICMSLAFLNGLSVSYTHLTAHEKFVELRICEIIQKFIIISSMGFCLFWGYGLYALVLANAIAGFIMIGIKPAIALAKTSAYKPYPVSYTHLY